MFYNEHGQPVYFGLGNSNKKVAGKKVSDIRKSSDDIGYTSVTIPPEIVGHKIAVFTTIEMKPKKFKIKDVYPKKSREFAQDKWNKMCVKAGGIGGFAKDKESMNTIFANFYARFK